MTTAEIYGFNIMVEAKTRALVAMTKKIHPEWKDEEIERFLKGAIEYAVKAEVSA